MITTILEMDVTILTPPIDFTPAELQAMCRYCCKYRDLVRTGGKPTPEQDETFFLFQRIAYTFEVAYAR